MEEGRLLRGHNVVDEQRDALWYFFSPHAPYARVAKVYPQRALCGVSAVFVDEDRMFEEIRSGGALAINFVQAFRLRYADFGVQPLARLPVVPVPHICASAAAKLIASTEKGGTRHISGEAMRDEFSGSE